MTRFVPGYKGPMIDPMLSPREAFNPRATTPNPRATTPNPTPPVIDNKPAPNFVVGATPPPPRGSWGFPKLTPTPRMRMMASGAGMKKGGKVSSASKRADGIAVRGKTKGKMV